MSRVIVSGRNLHVVIVINEGIIDAISLRQSERDEPAILQAESFVAREVAGQFLQYLRDGLADFTVELNEERLTDFQKRVFAELKAIPAGETISYSGLARRVGGSNYRRAVAQALKHNPFPIVIPCHRVLAKNGLGGFASGIPNKKSLLRLEMK